MARDRRWLWLAGVVVAVLGAVAWGVPLATLLTVAVLLACPAAMFFGMGMMGRPQQGGMACHAGTSGSAHGEASSAPFPGPLKIVPPSTPANRAGSASSAADGDPMLILKRRLAAGQITLEEYERLRVVLQATPSLSAGVAVDRGFTRPVAASEAG